MRKLSIIIVNWNTRELLRDCLESVYATAGSLALEVFVVDNASSDGSQAMVREHFPQTRLIENQSNLGFARANNLAFPLCSGDYILLLNSDTQLLGDALEKLVKYLASHADVGVVGPKIVHPDMRLRVLSCGHQPSVSALVNQYFFLSRFWPNRFKGINLLMEVHDDRPRAVEWISGACLLVRREIVQQVGPLSEDWFMYAEDMEWCQRIADGGWTLHHVPAAVVEHRFGSSSDQSSAVSTMWVCSQRSYYISREQPSRLKLLAFDLVTVLGLAIRVALYTIYALLRSQRRTTWQAEARKFWAYTITAAKLMVS